MFETIETHIKNSWRVRSSLDPAPDPKLDKDDVRHLYIPPTEDISVIRARVRARQKETGSTVPVEVHYLTQKAHEITLHGLLYLPELYVTPGARFDEMYGWDSYWIVRGLLRDGFVKLAKGMVENFYYQIEHYGKILNGNRTYYLTRSQPPFLGPMVETVAARLEGAERREFLLRANKTLTTNYRDFWCARRFTEETGLFHYGRAGHGKNGLCPEVVHGERDPVTGFSHYEKLALYFGSLPETDHSRQRFYDARLNSLTEAAIAGDYAMRESGFDPSMHLGIYGLETIDHNPVCLNTLLYRQCQILAAINVELGVADAAQEWTREAARLQSQIHEHLWDEELGLFMAYNYVTGQRAKIPFLTSAYPLWAGIATPAQAQRFRGNLPLFESDYGLVTSPHETECQWDGRIWPFLFDIGFEALHKSGFRDDAVRVGEHFLRTVAEGYKGGGTIFEKYGRDGSYDMGSVRVGYVENVTNFGPTMAVFLGTLDWVRANAAAERVDSGAGTTETEAPLPVADGVLVPA